jgi:hypothetical protein
VRVPLFANPYHAARKGRRCTTVQINAKDGVISVGALTDVGAPCRDARDACVAASEELSLDFGLTTMVATQGAT